MRRVLLALQLVALTVGLTACGGDVLSVDPAASAATKTIEAGSSRMDMRIRMTFAGESVAMSGSGLFDYEQARGAFSYRMQIPELGAVRMELRMLDGKLYLRMPTEIAGAALPGGKQWFALDLGAAMTQAGLGSLDLTGPQQDPAQALQYLRAASTDVKKAGRATVRGVATTRYTGRLDFRAALDAGLDKLELSAAERAQARAAMQSLVDQLDRDSIPYTVFVDEDGLLRRLTMDMAMAVQGERVSMTTSADYFDFGVDVRVEAPPATEVTDAAGLLQP